MEVYERDNRPGEWYWTINHRGRRHRNRAQHPENKGQLARTEREAIAYATLAEQRLQRGLPIFEPHARPKREKGEGTVAWFIEKYFSPYLEAKQLWFTNGGAWMCQQLQARLGPQQLHQFGPLQSRQFRAKLAAEVQAGTLAASSANKLLAAIHGLFELARKQRQFDQENPFDGLQQFEIVPKAKRALTMPEFEALVSACHSAKGQGRRTHFEHYLYCVVYTGARVNEFLDCLRSDVNLNASLPTVTYRSFKRGPHGQADGRPKRRVVPIPSPAIIHFQALLQLPDSEREGRTLSKRQRLLSTDPTAFLWAYGDPKKVWASVRAEAAKEFPHLADFDRRDLRYTCRAWNLKAGQKPHDLAAIMGHRLDVAEDHYSAVDLTEVLARMNAAPFSGAKVVSFQSHKEKRHAGA